MKTITFASLAACCWLVAGEMVWAQSSLQRLEEMIRQPKAASGAVPAESPLPPKAAATQRPAEPQEPGYLGVLADDKDDRGRGVRVLKVMPDGPADKAGFKPQDLITRVGGVPIRQMTELAAILQQMTPGATLSFEVLRGDGKQDLSVVFGRRPPEPRPSPPPAPGLEAPPTEGPAIPGAPAGPPSAGGTPTADHPVDAHAEIDRLLHRIEQLEKRVDELERAASEKKK